jgi:Hsp70 protein
VVRPKKKDAGRIAGLDVLRIIHEPTAAAPALRALTIMRPPMRPLFRCGTTEAVEELLAQHTLKETGS